MLLLSCGAISLPACASPGSTETPDVDGHETGAGEAADEESGSPSAGATEFDSESGEDSSTTSDHDAESGDEGPTCGNGIIEGGEACDDGVNDGTYGGCTTDCSALGPHCGDRIRDPGETCDEGSSNGPHTRCNVECQIPGTVIDSLHETIEVPYSADTRGVRTTTWNGRLTAVFGGSTASVWEIDFDDVETHRLRNTDVRVDPVAGAVGLDEDGLFIAAGTGWSRDAYRLDDDLNLVWTYVDADNASYLGFVGAASVEGQVVVGALYENGYAGNEFSAYWAAGLSRTGTTRWTSVDLFEGTSDYYARDLRALGPDRAVLLSDAAADAPSFRIYSGDGDVLAEDVLYTASEAYRTLCPGDEGFFLLGLSDLTLLGFDRSGDPTFETAVPAYVNRDAPHRASCAVLDDSSPIVALNLITESSMLLVAGFDGPDPTWLAPVGEDLGWSSGEPAVHIEEDRPRAWVFLGGSLESGDRFVYAAVVAT